MVGGHPKDFDIATSATPEEVKHLFRNCRLIGRRFRLAHVVFGREIIEVATFRANVDDGSGDRQVHDDGRLLRDNVRSEEHTSELQSLMRISYAVFCLKKKTQSNKNVDTLPHTIFEPTIQIHSNE